MKSFCCLVAWCLLLAAGSPQAQAAPVPWLPGVVDMRADNETLPSFLLRVFAKQRLAASISAGVGEPKVSGQFRLAPGLLLNELAATYGFVWYHFNGTIHISSLAESETRLLALPPGLARRLAATLQELGIADDRFVLKTAADGTAVALSGPPKYVELVEQTTRLLLSAAEVAPHEQVRVFPLQHAWADDRTIQVAGTETQIPGVASLVRTMLADEGAAAATGVQARPSRRVAERVPGAQGAAPAPAREAAPAGAGAPLPSLLSGLASLGGRSAAPAPVGKAAAAPPEGPPGARDSEPERPRPVVATVRADARLNAVIVRDRADRMTVYEELVRQLDKPSPLIEIEATVIDLASDESTALGVDLTALLSNRPDRAVAPVISTTPELLAGAQAPLGSIVLGSSRAWILGRINALATEGKASINQRPRVVTLDNVEAVLQSTQEFYVRVSGRDAGDLFKVEAGLTLRVTPTVRLEGSTVQYKLLVRIEDGSVSSRSLVDGLPSVQRSTISASVTIGQDESLFIGGLASETVTVDARGVPFLSSLPWLGGLFGTRSQSKSKTERLFLITPRLLRPA